MSEAETLKEKIGYLKLWLGIFVVTDISLIGWLASNYESAQSILAISGFIAFVVVSTAIFLLHKKIERELDRLRET